ncbi:hypothetical protein HOLleu_44920 [Holothuria leucospilota]|uniref:HIN-200 domain-containing protein n=1 Tax=Holothuria leucospilota TaxID=206669 RepID=A0A9Q0Y8H9_HOLLE|nr:hypothetical protein HOLleu_44920 [Holothuria leucospilota]
MFTIKDLLTLRPAPYTKMFKCKVLVISAPKPFSTKGEQKELYHIALGDQTGLIKATLYDEDKLKQMKVGSSVMLTNYIVKADKSVTITSASKVFRCADIDVDDVTQDSAQQLINPAPQKVCKIKLIKSSPKKTLTSLQGQITKDEAAKQVMVRGTPSAVRNIFVKDETDEIEVALWRSSAETDATVNDWIEVTNVVVNEPNTYHTQTFVATTQNTTIKVSSKSVVF